MNPSILLTITELQEQRRKIDEVLVGLIQIFGDPAASPKAASLPTKDPTPTENTRPGRSGTTGSPSDLVHRAVKELARKSATFGNHQVRSQIIATEGVTLPGTRIGAIMCGLDKRGFIERAGHDGRKPIWRIRPPADGSKMLAAIHAEIDAKKGTAA